ncbi:MAG: type II toxin-antitoxin system VapC family toxin [bacterium]
MKPVVYLETSVVSYLAGRPSRDLVVAGRQEVSRDWWERRRVRYALRISVLVLQEIRRGDRAAAREREDAVADVPVLEITLEAQRLAVDLVKGKAVPAQSEEDALHIALACVHGADYLLTWNFKHINNAETKRTLVEAIEEAGYECPMICSPEELMGG